MWWNHKQSNNLIFDDRWAFDVHIHKIVSFFLVHKRQKRRRRYDFYINFLLVAIVIPLYTGWGNSCINWEASSFSHKIFTFFSFVFCFFLSSRVNSNIGYCDLLFFSYTFDISFRIWFRVSFALLYFFVDLHLILNFYYLIYFQCTVRSNLFLLFSVPFDFFCFDWLFNLGFSDYLRCCFKKKRPPPSRFELLDCVPSTVKVHHSLGL